MYESPTDLPDKALRASLRAGYGLAVIELTFLPLGHNSLAWAYRVETAGGAGYFLKVRRRAVTEASLVVPCYLHQQGITQVIAPLPTTTQSLRTEAGDYTLILYPFVEGNRGKERGMTASQWIAYGTLLRLIHAAPRPPELVRLMPRETFAPPGSDLVRD